MAGAEKFGDGQAGDGAAALPVVQQALPEDVLAHALDDQTLGFGCSWQGRRAGDEGMEQFVWKRFAELEGPADQVMENRDVRDDPGSYSPCGKRLYEGFANRSKGDGECSAHGHGEPDG